MGAVENANPQEGRRTPTDHSVQILALRDRAESLAKVGPKAYSQSVGYAMAADLLEIHDATGLSLDNWPVALEFISLHLRWCGTGIEIKPNGA